MLYCCIVLFFYFIHLSLILHQKIMNSGCAASSSETQLDEATAELPFSGGLAELAETGSWHANMSSQENLAV